jgi:hypothetical protein
MRRHNNTLADVFGAAIGLLAIISTANAAGVITTYTSRGAFPGNDSLDWGQLGPPETTITAPFSATSVGGLTINVTQPGNASFGRADEGIDWTGNFNIGEHLLWNGDNTGEMDFSQEPIAGFGTASEPDASGPYTATLSAFAGTTPLGSITVSSPDSVAEDGTAPFAGITDSVAEITRLVITVDAGGVFNDGFAIDSVSLATAAAVPMPEPPTIAVIGPLLLFWWVFERRKNYKARKDPNTGKFAIKDFIGISQPSLSATASASALRVVGA